MRPPSKLRLLRMPASDDTSQYHSTTFCDDFFVEIAYGSTWLAWGLLHVHTSVPIKNNNSCQNTSIFSIPKQTPATTTGLPTPIVEKYYTQESLTSFFSKLRLPTMAESYFHRRRPQLPFCNLIILLLAHSMLAGIKRRNSLFSCQVSIRVGHQDPDPAPCPMCCCQ